MIKFRYETEKAKRIIVDIKGDVQKYAVSFLHIVNNARENSNVFYKVENCYDNRVFVTCNPSYCDDVKEYLENFGKILEVCDINKVDIFFDYDIKNDYEKLYPSDCDDTEFFVEAD